MRTTLVIDDELLAEALLLTGLAQRSAVMNEALKALIAREIVQHVGVPKSVRPFPIGTCRRPQLTRSMRLRFILPARTLYPPAPIARRILRDAISGLTIWTAPPRQLVENGRLDHSRH